MASNKIYNNKRQHIPETPFDFDKADADRINPYEFPYDCKKTLLLLN